jgi:hypothetical protein
MIYDENTPFIYNENPPYATVCIWLYGESPAKNVVYTPCIYSGQPLFRAKDDQSVAILSNYFISQTLAEPYPPAVFKLDPLSPRGEILRTQNSATVFISP